MIGTASAGCGKRVEELIVRNGQQAVLPSASPMPAEDAGLRPVPLWIGLIDVLASEHATQEGQQSHVSLPALLS